MGKVIRIVCTITDQLIRTRPICPNCKYEHTERSYKKSAGGMKMTCADCGESIIIGSPKHKKNRE